MNKEQQIEEMLKIMCEEYGKQCNDCIVETCSNKVISERLFENGYRKIPEDNIRETVEKPVDTQKREYENIDDIARGFVVKDGKIMYVTNILDEYRHEFKDIYEICDEMNAMMKKLDRLMELNNHLRFQLGELKAENNSLKRVDEFAECRNCSAWSGSDCTRHPYTQGCLKDENSIKRQAVKEFAEKLKEGLCVFFDENENNDGSIDKGILLVDIIGVEAKNGDTISIGMIDDLLKEYEND